MNNNQLMNNAMIAKGIFFFLLFGSMVLVPSLEAQSFVTPLTSITGDTSIGGIAVSGGEAKAYFIIQNGTTIEITRRKYAKEYFNQLFSDCPEMAKAYPEPDFADFAEHVLYYEKMCR